MLRLLRSSFFFFFSLALFTIYSFFTLFLAFFRLNHDIIFILFYIFYFFCTFVYFDFRMSSPEFKARVRRIQSERTTTNRRNAYGNKFLPFRSTFIKHHKDLKVNCFFNIFLSFSVYVFEHVISFLLDYYLNFL